MKNYSLISKVTLWVLLAIGLIVSAMVFLGGNEAEGLEVAGDVLAVPVFTDLFLNWNYFLLLLAIAVTLVFVVAGFIRLWKSDKKKAAFTLGVLVAFVLLFVICWFLGSPEKIQIIGYEGTDNVAGTRLYAIPGESKLSFIYAPRAQRCLTFAPSLGCGSYTP